METSTALKDYVSPVIVNVQKSSQAEIDQALVVLSTNKDAWAMMDIPRRIALLKQVKKDVHKVEKRWVDAGMAAKGAEPGTVAEGEEWASIAETYRLIRFLIEALQDIARVGKPRIPGKVTTRPNGQVVAQVMPHDWKEQMTLPGVRAEVWMDPSVSLQDGGIHQASFYHRQDRTGQVCAILGAGNVSVLVPSDCLYKLFVEGQVVALKMNPVNEYLGPIFEEAFSALIKAGYLQIIYGGAQEGGYLCNHPVVDNVHMTGSDRTFEAIVFGPGAEGQQRKQARQPIFTKPFTAELGNISPMIVVPGPWTEKDIANWSLRLGSWLNNNCAHNCNTPRMLIQMKNWDHREKLNQGIADFLAGMKTRKAYYPGSFELHKQFVDAHPNAIQLGSPQEGHLPWTFIPDVDSTIEDDICFKHEPFMSLWSETALESDSVVEYIDRAVEFANKKIWGTLAAYIVVHPESMKDPQTAAAVDQAIANLRYGTVVVNYWGGLSYYLMTAPWGGYPNTDIYDVQSGIGFVNNPLMFDRPQKSVVYAQFDLPIDPTLVNVPNNYLYFAQAARYEFNPTPGNLFKMFWTIMTLK
jgi:acyl-CoA reductase-like NAD-dependent aldehyde dehydrogenase